MLITTNSRMNLLHLLFYMCMYMFSYYKVSDYSDDFTSLMHQECVIHISVQFIIFEKCGCNCMYQVHRICATHPFSVHMCSNIFTTRSSHLRV